MNALTSQTSFPSPTGRFCTDSPSGRDINEFFRQGLAVNSLPAVNVIEHAAGFRIDVAAPGLKKEDFKLSLHHNNLTISAYQESKADETGTTDGQYTHREFGYTSFRRAFALPASANVNEIHASYTDGVLAIEIPKREDAKLKPARQIEVG